jgi:hypothetical protein
MAAAAGLIALFAFRLAFGLSSDFYFEDPTQIFLIGLRYYATGQWPFFGPDVVWTQSQIPGALQGLIVGLPFKVAALPESPFVLVNALSFAAICLMAWYLTKALPTLPKWLVYGWFLTVPWTLQFSTQIINPSWVTACRHRIFRLFLRSGAGVRTRDTAAGDGVLHDGRRDDVRRAVPSVVAVIPSVRRLRMCGPLP